MWFKPYKRIFLRQRELNWSRLQATCNAQSKASIARSLMRFLRQIKNQLNIFQEEIRHPGGRSWMTFSWFKKCLLRSGDAFFFQLLTVQKEQQYCCDIRFSLIVFSFVCRDFQGVRGLNSLCWCCMPQKIKLNKTQQTKPWRGFWLL